MLYPLACWWIARKLPERYTMQKYIYQFVHFGQLDLAQILSKCLHLQFLFFFILKTVAGLCVILLLLMKRITLYIFQMTTAKYVQDVKYIVAYLSKLKFDYF